MYRVREIIAMTRFDLYPNNLRLILCKNDASARSTPIPLMPVVSTSNTMDKSN